MQATDSGRGDNFGKKLAYQSNQAPSPMPAVCHLTEKYDPAHPDADWAGIVQRHPKKRFYEHQHAARDCLMNDEKGGLMPSDQAGVVPESFSGKRIYENNQVHHSEPPMGHGLHPVAHEGGADWKTSYMAQTSLEATSKDQYVAGSSKNSQHKRHVTPLYEQAQATRRAQARTGSPLQISGDPSSRGSSPAGSNSTPFTARRGERRSLLADIGKRVAAEDKGGNLIPPERHFPVAYSDRTNKSMVSENYHHVKLGYTGRAGSLRK